MNVTHGMNVEEVEALGRLLQRNADLLREIAGSVNSAVFRSDWGGDDAAIFRDRHWPTHRSRLASVADGIHGFGQSALNNAAEQRTASEARDVDGRALPGGGLPKNHILFPALIGGSLTGRSIAWFYRNLGEYERGERPVGPGLTKVFPELQWAVTDGRTELRGMLDKSPAEQAKWWAGLSHEQQRALLFAYPGLLAGMEGLSSEVRAAAAEQYALSRRGEVAVRVDAESASASVNVGVVKVGAEATATTVVYGDGSAEVTLSLTGDMGREFGAGSVGVEGGAHVTYRFLTAEDAQQFVEGLKSRLDPNLMESLAGDDAMSFIRHHDWARESTTLSLAVEGSLEAKLGGAELKISGSAGGTYDVDSGARTLFVEVDASASAGGLGGDVSGKVELQMDANGNVTGAKLSGSIGLSGDASVGAVLQNLSGETLAGGETSASVGGEVQFEASIDPDDPRVQARLRQLVANPGDQGAMRELLRLSEAEVSVNTTSESGSSYKVAGTGVETSRSSTETQVTYVKSPGGVWTAVPR